MRKKFAFLEFHVTENHKHSISEDDEAFFRNPIMLKTDRFLEKTLRDKMQQGIKRPYTLVVDTTSARQLLFELHEKRETLGTHIKHLQLLCRKCDLGDECKRINHVGKLTIYCLEGVFKKLDNNQEDKSDITNLKSFI